jgi:GABA(A) receptor-associated protein
MENFKSEFDFQERKFQTEGILKKHPTRVPTFVFKRTGSKGEEIPKNKFLVPKDITVGQFVFVVRKQLKLTPEQAIFVFVGNKIPPTSALINDLYNRYADPDGFLYVEYAFESVFG